MSPDEKVLRGMLVFLVASMTLGVVLMTLMTWMGY